MTSVLRQIAIRPWTLAAAAERAEAHCCWTASAITSTAAATASGATHRRLRAHHADQHQGLDHDRDRGGARARQEPRRRPGGRPPAIAAARATSAAASSRPARKAAHPPRTARRCSCWRTWPRVGRPGARTSSPRGPGRGRAPRSRPPRRGRRRRRDAGPPRRRRDGRAACRPPPRPANASTSEGRAPGSGDQAQATALHTSQAASTPASGGHSGRRARSPPDGCRQRGHEETGRAHLEEGGLRQVREVEEPGHDDERGEAGDDGQGHAHP